MNRSKVLALIILTGIVISCGFSFASTAQLTAAETTGTTPSRPNILLILTDDETTSDMSHMPQTKALIGGQGVTFSNANVTYSLCCPSRATIFRGQYAHNTGVLSNAPPLGAAPKFRSTGDDQSTVATWLQDAGYQTAFFGKYLNNYGGNGDTYEPPGWDEWHALSGIFNQGPRINNNGTVETLSDGTIFDQALKSKADSYLQGTDPSKPFFMEFATHSPHSPYDYPASERTAFSAQSAPRDSATNEKNISDKPSWLRHRYPDRLTTRQMNAIDAHYRDRMRAITMVDGMVAGLVQDLKDRGELDNTYIIFTSDNGWSYGDNRLRGKWNPYIPAHQVPMMMRGPGIPAGVSRSQFALNNDLAPTISEWAGVTPPHTLDGRSLSPLLTTDANPAWRTRFLYEGWHDPKYKPSPPRYQGIRTKTYSYTEYPGLSAKQRELYNLKNDPHQRHNVYDKASRKLKVSLHARLQKLSNCEGDACRTAED